MKTVGRPISRIEGRAKVTGTARYAAEHPAEELLHGAVVNARIARGTITKLDPSGALALDGVVQVFTHENCPRLAWFDKSWRDQDSPYGAPFRPLYDAEIRFADQPIALVVADTPEIARHAAALIEAEYTEKDHATALVAHADEAREPKKWGAGRKPPPKAKGDADAALAAASHTIDARYVFPCEHHNPMEPHATTVIADDDGSFTVYDKTQGVLNSAEYLQKVFGLKEGQLRVRAPYVGGAFGSGLRPQYQAFFAMLAATQLQRSVRVVMSRHQMFTFGHRPAAIQRIALGAKADGTLESLIHETKQETSRFEEYVEVTVNWSGLLYKTPNLRTAHEIVSLDYNTPLDMRAPGASWGVHAIETAIDELAVKLAIDPIELRRRNYTERDELDDKDFGSKELRACWDLGAERFGWSRREAEPRTTRAGHELVGLGMASGVWDAMHMPAKAHASLGVDGRLTLTSAVTDIGTGTYTIMTQIAADTLGVPIDHITFRLGDSKLPMAPLQGGSWTAVTVGSAIRSACEGVAKTLFELAEKMPNSPLEGSSIDEIDFVEGGMQRKAEPTKRVSHAQAMRFGQRAAVAADALSVPNPKRALRSHYAHSAVFAEVRVDEDLGIVRVARIVSAVAAGRIVNPKTAANQIAGAVVWGIGMALEEESLVDHRLGRVMNHSLAEYHVPVNKDVPAIDVIFVPEHDEHVNALGAKGLGEIGLVGVAAAIGNAIYNATGKRIRELPITLDKLL